MARQDGGWYWTRRGGAGASFAGLGYGKAERNAWRFGEEEQVRDGRK